MLELLALAFLIACSYTDLRTKEVPDFLANLFLACAMIGRTIFLLLAPDLTLSLSSLLLALSFLGGFGFAMYMLGQWAEGDLRVALACSFLLSASFPFFLDFFFNIFICGALYGVVYAFSYAAMRGERRKLIPALSLFILGICLLPFADLLAMSGLLLICIASISFLNQTKHLFIVEKEPSELVRGDWLAEEVRVGRKGIRKRKTGLTEGEIKELIEWWRKGKIKKVKIKEGIPFIPSFLFALIATLFFGNLIYFLTTRALRSYAPLALFP